MALILHLKSVDNLRSTCNRKAKVTFRGVCHYSKVIENASETANFDEIFEWPVARPIESEECLDIHIFNYSKYLNNRLIGTFRIILQELIEVGHIEVSDTLLDSNNVAMKTKVDFELTYNAPDGSVGIWQKGGFEDVQAEEEEEGEEGEDGKQLIIKNQRHSLPSSPQKYGKMSKFSAVAARGSFGISPSGAAKFSSLVKNVMKQKPEDSNKQILGEAEAEVLSVEGKSAKIASSILSAFGTDSTCTEDDQRSESTGSAIMTPTKMHRPKVDHHMEHASLRAQDFQVSNKVYCESESV
ncbi:otoferlin-like [Octopus bimaculoides]|uniref:otoferlin-like n=1 Tax=Octopus bimaculoides TaxID=37653 RepID=UPI00071C752A|nr:otoferlin-like [Octopus bimaculoides]|eukprot:XP_014771947.1 PREDICTED: otoferlin-like [Octopus bimaculoides]